MSKLGRRISAYHPEIRVRRGDRVVVIQADLDDWYEDQEVLGKLAVGYPGCRTVGDLVEAIEHGDGEPHPPLPLRDTGVMSCRILEVGAEVQAAEAPLRDWDEPI